jgi:hypothetical protein
MTVHTIVTAALAPVLANSWAKELPPNPTFPAIVFDIDSAPEPQWSAAGGYTAHELQLVVMAMTMEELDVLLPADGGGPVRLAVQALASFQFEEDSGDADYEPDAKVYARFITVRLRTPRY